MDVGVGDRIKIMKIILVPNHNVSYVNHINVCDSCLFY